MKKHAAAKPPANEPDQGPTHVPVRELKAFKTDSKFNGTFDSLIIFIRVTRRYIESSGVTDARAIGHFLFESCENKIQCKPEFSSEAAMASPEAFYKALIRDTLDLSEEAGELDAWKALEIHMKQREVEKVAEFTARLGGLGDIMKIWLGEGKEELIKTTMRKALASGLSNMSLRGQAALLSKELTFEEAARLIVEAARAMDVKPEGKPTPPVRTAEAPPIKAAMATVERDRIGEVADQVQVLAASVNRLLEQQQQPTKQPNGRLGANSNPSPTCWRCGIRGHRAFDEGRRRKCHSTRTRDNKPLGPNEGWDSLEYRPKNG